jgi:SPP1 gp7 family putative phage head morphogenesis protein
MCKKCGIITLSMPNMGNLEPELKRIAQLIIDGKLKPGQIDKVMVKKIAEQLMKGIFKGYGKELSSKDLTPAERTFLNQINDNVYVFSGFKNYQQLQETSLLLKNDDGVIKPFNEFLNDVLQVDKTYNEVYLAAEYSNAVASAQMAQAWQDFENNGVEMLTYQTANDDRVRDDHAIMEGITLPIDDPFWSTYYPPNDWGCRCDAVPTTETKEVREPASSLPDIPEMFQNNVGQSGIVFPDTHPYFDVSKGVAKSINEQVKDILKEED